MLSADVHYALVTMFDGKLIRKDTKPPCYDWCVRYELTEEFSGWIIRIAQHNGAVDISVSHPFEGETLNKTVLEVSGSCLMEIACAIEVV